MYQCTLSPGFSIEPKLEFVSFSKESINQYKDRINGDSIYMKVYFEDGDGDIGNDKLGIIGLTIIDNRTGDVYDRYNIPMLPEQGAGNGISGEITVRLLNTCCVFPDDIPPCESPPEYPTNSLSFSLVLEDRAGHVSDTIVTPELTLYCN